MSRPHCHARRGHAPQDKPPRQKPQWSAAAGREGRWRLLRTVINEAGDSEGALKWWLGEMAAGRSLYRYHLEDVCRVGGLHAAWFQSGEFTASTFSVLKLGDRIVWMLEVFYLTTL
jgi:hypothetical protein